MRKVVSYLIVVLILICPLIVCAEQKGGMEMKIKVESPAFTEGGKIPKQYTCDGTDISPPLTWSGIPEGTKSIAIIADDPDAPMGTWVHWVVYDLPPDLTGLQKNIPLQEILANGAKHGMNDFRRTGYGGPCPPGGTHRYFFTVYALDAMLGLDAGATKKFLLKAMEDRVLAKGALMGKYKRQ